MKKLAHTHSLPQCSLSLSKLTLLIMLSTQIKIRRGEEVDRMVNTHKEQCTEIKESKRELRGWKIEQNEIPYLFYSKTEFLREN